MRKSTHQKHFLYHTAEHLLGVLGILVVASGVAIMTPRMGQLTSSDVVRPTEPTLHVASVLSSGISLYWEGATDNIGVVGYRLFKNSALLVSQTMPTFTDTDLQPGALVEYTIAAVDASGNSSLLSNPTFAVVPPSSPALTADETEIYFSVTPAPVTDCSTGKPMHEVFFVVSNPEGGDFLLTSSSDLAARKTVAWGRQLLPNGLYTWNGVPREGYTLLGIGSGQVNLTGECLVGSTGTSVLDSATLLLDATDTESNATVTPRPTLRFFVDSIPVSDTERQFRGENVELRVTVSQAKKVSYIAMKEGATVPVTLGVGVYDDLLSMKGNDVWVLTWQTRNISSGTYRVFARVLSLSGEVSESLPLSVIITQPQGITSPDIQDDATSSAQSNALTLKSNTPALKVTDATRCEDARSCKAYCAQGSSESDRCFTYAQEALAGTSSKEFSSFAEGVSFERISKLLTDLSRRPKDLPEYVSTATAFVSFCRDAGHAEICQRILLRGDLVAQADITARMSVMGEEREAVNNVISMRSGVRAFIDTDGDHVSDYDEVNIFGTNPDNADSDEDGFMDGEEIINHTHPLGANRSGTPDVAGTATLQTSSEEVHMEDPRLVSGFTSSQLSVDHVAISPDGESADKSVLAFSGTAPKNSYVSLFVFSDPISMSVKTNASGTWSYVLREDLAPGAHQAIVTISNATGRVLLRSSTLNFVKDGSVVTLTPVASTLDESPFSSAHVFAIVALLLASLGIAFSVIGILFHRRSVHHGTQIVSQ